MTAANTIAVCVTRQGCLAAAHWLREHYRAPQPTILGADGNGKPDAASAAELERLLLKAGRSRRKRPDGVPWLRIPRPLAQWLVWRFGQSTKLIQDRLTGQTTGSCMLLFGLYLTIESLASVCEVRLRVKRGGHNKRPLEKVQGDLAKHETARRARTLRRSSLEAAWFAVPEPPPMSRQRQAVLKSAVRREVRLEKWYAGLQERGETILTSTMPFPD